MRLRGKLGEIGAERMIALVIILFTTLVLFGIMFKVRDVVADSAGGVCAADVRRAHLIQKFAGTEYTPEIKSCQTEAIYIKQSELPEDDAKRQQAIRHTLAEEMRECWQEWGSGELDLFNGTGEYCHFCSTIHFDQSYGELSAFNKYLATTTAPGTSTKDHPLGRTYEQVLTGVARNFEEAPAIDAGPYDVPTGQPLVVMFWYSKTKERSAIEKLLNTDGPTATEQAYIGGGAAFAAVVGTKAVLAIAGVANPIGLTVAAVATAGGFAYGYIDGRIEDDYYVLSATYLTPYTEDNEYVKKCRTAASTTVSP